MSNKPLYKKYTAGAVAIFIVLFIWGMQDSYGAEVRLGLGKGMTNGNDWITQEFMLVGKRKWYLSAMLTGNDDQQPDTWRYAVGYRVNWRDHTRASPFMRLGAAYWQDKPVPLISDHVSYDMAVGVRVLHVVELEWQHNSTSGRSDQNKGNDLFTLAMVFTF
jgi:hypothetical protein